MLMFPNSGLSTVQVARMRMTHAEAPVQFHMLKFILPIVACSIGGAIAGAMLNAVLAIIILIGGASMVMSVLLMAQRVRKLIADGSQQVTVVRSGLLRVVNVDQVVVGDLLVLEAGALVPVDGLESTVQVKESRFLNALGIQNGAIFAGMRVATRGTIRVTAVGTQRRLVLALTDGKPVTVKQLLFMLVAGVRQLLLDARPVVRVVFDLMQRGFDRARADFVRHAARTAVMGTGHLRLTQIENAFRYNQGPVS